jgi:hypothetical protein
MSLAYSGDKMMAVAIESEPSFSAAQPKELFEGRYERNEWCAYR